MTTPRHSPSHCVEPAPPEATRHDPVALWASAQVTALNVADVPEYGSPAWSALRATDLRRAAAIVTAAEHWRRHAAREAWLDCLLVDDPERWFAYVTADANAYASTIAPALARRPTHDELAARRARRTQTRPIAASAGWPPIAVPGRAGWWRHYGPRGKQIDLPHNHPQERPHCDPRDQHGPIAA